MYILFCARCRGDGLSGVTRGGVSRATRCASGRRRRCIMRPRWDRRLRRVVPDVTPEKRFPTAAWHRAETAGRHTRTHTSSSPRPEAVPYILYNVRAFSTHTYLSTAISPSDCFMWLRDFEYNIKYCYVLNLKFRQNFPII